MPGLAPLVCRQRVPRLAGRAALKYRAHTVSRDRLTMPGVPRLYKSLRVKAVAHVPTGVFSDSRCQRRPLAWLKAPEKA